MTAKHQVHQVTVFAQQDADRTYQSVSSVGENSNATNAIVGEVSLLSHNTLVPGTVSPGRSLNELPAAMEKKHSLPSRLKGNASHLCQNGAEEDNQENTFPLHALSDFMRMKPTRGERENSLNLRHSRDTRRKSTSMTYAMESPNLTRHTGHTGALLHPKTLTPISHTEESPGVKGQPAATEGETGIEVDEGEHGEVTVPPHTTPTEIITIGPAEEENQSEIEVDGRETEEIGCSRNQEPGQLSLPTNHIYLKG